MGIICQTGNRWLAEGKKRQKDSMPKKASQKCFPALSTAAMSPSIISLSSLGKEKEDRGPGGVQRLDQRALASTSKRLGSLREFFWKWLFCIELSWHLQVEWCKTGRTGAQRKIGSAFCLLFWENNWRLPWRCIFKYNKLQYLETSDTWRYCVMPFDWLYFAQKLETKTGNVWHDTSQKNNVFTDKVNFHLKTSWPLPGARPDQSAADDR